MNAYDPSGMDAVIITDTNAVDLPVIGKQGHTSAVVQDDNGTWWYFYWGNNNVQLIEAPDWAMNSLQNFNKWLSPKTYNGNYNESTYIKGDFTDSYEYYKELASQYHGGKNKNYSWNHNNCLTVTIKGINRGILSDGTSVSRFNSSNYGIIPNNAAKQLSKDFYNDAFTYKDYYKQINDQLWLAKYHLNRASQNKTFKDYTLAQLDKYKRDVFRLKKLYY